MLSGMRSEGDCIDMLGGTGAVATALGLLDSTVSGWRDRGIPPARWPSIVKLAESLGKPVTFEVLAGLRANRLEEARA